MPDENAIHITGHKHSNSMNKYRTLNENRKEEMSQILSTTTDIHSVTHNVNVNTNTIQTNGGQTNSEPTLQHTSTMTSSRTHTCIPNSYSLDIFQINVLCLHNKW